MRARASGEIGIGILGAGSMSRAYAECLARHTHGARLIAVAGGSRAPEVAAAYGVSADDSPAALVRRSGVHAVIVATPEMKHCEQTLLAAGAGKHVLVEKPMAPTVGECDAMIDACRRSGVNLMVVKHWRFRGVHVRARECLASGGLGPIRRIANHTLTPQSSSVATASKKPFYLDPAGGGLLMGWAVHNLDWVRHLAGSEPVSVASTMREGTSPFVEGGFEARILFANGIEADVRVAIDLPDDPGPDQVFRSVVSAGEAELDLNGYGDFRVKERGVEHVVWTQPKFDPRDSMDPLRLEAYAAMLQGFIDSVADGREPPVTGHDGRMAVALFRAVQRAAKHGGAVTP